MKSYLLSILSETHGLRLSNKQFDFYIKFTTYELALLPLLSIKTGNLLGHLSRMGFPILLNWTSQFLTEGFLGSSFFYILSLK